MPAITPIAFATFPALITHLETIPRIPRADVYLGERSYERAGELGLSPPSGTSPWILPEMSPGSRLPRRPPEFAKRIFAYQEDPFTPRQLQFLSECLRVGGLLCIGTPNAPGGLEDPFSRPKAHDFEILSDVKMTPVNASSPVVLLSAKKHGPLERAHVLHRISGQVRWSHLGLLGVHDLFPKTFHPPRPKIISTPPMSDAPKPDEEDFLDYKGSYLGTSYFPGGIARKARFVFGRFGLQFTPGFGESLNGLDLHLLDHDRKKQIYRVALLFHAETESLLITEMSPEQDIGDELKGFKSLHDLHPGNFMLILLIEAAKARGFHRVGGIRFMDILPNNVVGEYEGRFRQVGLRYLGGRTYERAIEPNWDPLKGCGRSRDFAFVRKVINTLALELATWFAESDW